MQVISFTEARNNFKTVIDGAVENADVTVINRRDSENAVLMSLDHYNSLMETVHLLRSPANAAHLQRSIEQYRQGEAQERSLDES
jgi:antitoxin YefM